MSHKVNVQIHTQIDIHEIVRLISEVAEKECRENLCERYAEVLENAARNIRETLRGGTR